MIYGNIVSPALHSPANDAIIAFIIRDNMEYRLFRCSRAKSSQLKHQMEVHIIF
ncbi:Uncharacterised protein [Klebsiella pneumoniae]|nr:Uncharacterised protein [Klebsiella pneumoniae]